MWGEVVPCYFLERALIHPCKWIIIAMPYIDMPDFSCQKALTLSRLGHRIRTFIDTDTDVFFCCCCCTFRIYHTSLTIVCIQVQSMRFSLVVSGDLSHTHAVDNCDTLDEKFMPSRSVTYLWDTSHREKGNVLDKTAKQLDAAMTNVSLRACVCFSGYIVCGDIEGITGCVCVWLLYFCLLECTLCVCVSSPLASVSFIRY